MMFGPAMFHVKHKKYRIKKYIPLTDKTVIDLGGVKIKVINAFGHTPGSVVFLDESIRHCLQEMPWVQEAGHGYGFPALIIHLSIEIPLLNYPEALSTIMAIDSFQGTGNREQEGRI